jgi:hypothetical protein
MKYMRRTYLGLHGERMAVNCGLWSTNYSSTIHTYCYYLIANTVYTRNANQLMLLREITAFFCVWESQQIHKYSPRAELIIIIIINLSWSWATYWPVPVSHVQKPLQRSAMIPYASWTAVFHYPG